MKKKILVADDSLTIQKVVELTFADTDYRLTCVGNGRLALEKVREERPDVILADVVMPEKNGYEVCEEIKKNPATATIPVILLAGTFEPFDRGRATDLGCDAIISKPFDSRELYRKVEALVASRPTAPAPNSATSEPATAPATPTSFPQPAPNPFDAGFVEEDFTGSIRTLRAGRGEPLANLYGPEDVESALAAFRDVEPTARAADWHGAAGSPEPASSARPTQVSGIRHLDEGGDAEGFDEPPAPRISIGSPEPRFPDASDDGRTQRIDVSDFRPPESHSGLTTMEVGRDVLEPLPPLPVEEAPRVAAPVVSEEARESRSGPSETGASLHDLSEADLDRLAEKVANRLVEKLASRIVRDVAWEVVPETAELVVRERLRELESGVE
jgi:CheY-like chemotaxis protein